MGTDVLTFQFIYDEEKQRKKYISPAARPASTDFMNYVNVVRAVATLRKIGVIGIYFFAARPQWRASGIQQADEGQILSTQCIEDIVVYP